MPYFYQENLSQNLFALSAEEAKHITKSMRLTDGDTVCITDGKGTLARAALTNTYKNCCEVEILERVFYEKLNRKEIHLAVAPTKNQDRMEWLVEKAVEIGVSQISFIICERSERRHIDLNRLHRIAVAALKQSQGVWLPELKTMTFLQFVSDTKNHISDKFIAYCDINVPFAMFSDVEYQHNSTIFLIGPEGDFTSQEVMFAKENGFQPISLGNKILRTETAALFVLCVSINS